MKKQTFNPDPLAKWSEKINDDYGLSYAKLIAQDWFDGGMITDECEYGTRRDYIINNRRIARGQEDTDSYKKHMARQTGDLDYLNLTWKMINIPGKFCRVVYNGISDENYNIDIRANDQLSVINKQKRISQHRTNMRSMPLLKKVKEGLGLDLIPQGFIPEDEEELRLYAEINDRPKIEIAEEIIIDYINKTNNKDVLERKKNKDLVEIGISAERIWTDPVNGVMFEYVDPEYLVHSYVNRNDFSDSYYYGYVDTVTLDDIKRDSNYSEAHLRKIAKSWATHNKRYNEWFSCDLRELLDYKVQVLKFAFKTTKTEVYKVKVKDDRPTKAIKKDEDYKQSERSDYKKVTDTQDTWMEGTYIIDSDYIYNYQECENLVRDERNRAMPPFKVEATDIHKNQLHSFLDDIKVPARELQYIHLKMQHLTAELKPDLVIINEDALADLKGTGKKDQMWNDTLNLLNTKGVVVEKTVDMGEMGVRNIQAARPSANSQGSALPALLNQWAHYYNAIRDTTGVNPARDGSLPHDALLGVNQMAQLASNTSTKHIVDASISFNKAHTEIISSRVHNIFKSRHEGANKIKKMYEKAVGKHNIDAVEALKDRHLHDFGFTVNMVPTQKELQEFKEDLTLFIQTNGQDVEAIGVKNKAQQIAKTNIKLANEYLFYMAKKINKRRLEERQKEAAFKSEQDRMSAISATKAKAQASAVEAEIELEKEKKMVQLRVYEKQIMQQVEAPVKQKEFEQDVFLKRLEEISNFNKSKYMEDRKDNRTKIQATQQARMIPERKSENPQPIDFENDSIFDKIF